MDAVNFKKMEDYVAFLAAKGAGEEKSKSYAESIVTHLKLVDVLLVMADVAPSYTKWVSCTTSAENFQKKIKSLLALASLSKDKNEQDSAAVSPVATTGAAVSKKVA